MLSSTCWKVKSEKNSNLITYNIQLDGVSRRQAKTFLEVMSGWHKYADGHNSKGQAILIFRKSFESRCDWVKWARSFPYDLFEEKENGKVEKIKRYKSNKKVKTLPAVKAKGRVCSLCKARGHNKQTCPERLSR